MGRARSATTCWCPPSWTGCSTTATSCPSTVPATGSGTTSTRKEETTNADPRTTTYTSRCTRNDIELDRRQDPQARVVAGCSELERARVGGYRPPLPGDADHPQCPARFGRGRSGRTGSPVRRLPARDAQARPGVAAGGVRLASLPSSSGVVHGIGGTHPSQSSSGGGSHRGKILKAAKARPRRRLVQGTWQDQHPPYVGSVISSRLVSGAAGERGRAGVAQLRVCGRFGHLAAARTTNRWPPPQWPGSSPGRCAQR